MSGPDGQCGVSRAQFANSLAGGERQQRSLSRRYPHIDLVEQMQKLIPEGAQVTFLGDGEFDGTTLQATVADYGWQCVCRTAQNTILTEAGDAFAFADVDVRPGGYISLPDVLFTLDCYGPVHAIAWWHKGCQEPIYLVSNIELAAEACFWYRKRFRIETFFSDQKSRGFNLHKSHLADSFPYLSFDVRCLSGLHLDSLPGSFGYTRWFG